MAKNIEAAVPGKLQWNSGDTNASLQLLATYVEEEAKAAMAWYWRSKGGKAFLSRWIKFLAVALTAGAGLAPIVGNISGTPAETSVLLPSLLVGLAAGLIALDRAFGFSSGWARYVLAATNIHKALEEFRLDWSSMLAGTDGNPSRDQVLALIKRAKEFRIAVEDLILQETKDWATEFQNNVAQLEKEINTQVAALKTQLQQAQQTDKAANQPGSIELVILNAEKVDDTKVQIRLENKAGTITEESIAGSNTWVYLDAPPGSYRVAAQGTAAGKIVTVAGAIAIRPGEICKLQLSLPI